MSDNFLHDPKRPVTLYTWVMSPFAMKVHAFLLFKRINFRCFYVNPLKRHSQIPVGDQIPVVAIGNECRADSTPIGLWIEEAFPEQPQLLPTDSAEREKVLAINDWVTDRLIPIVFRIPQEPGFNVSRISNGWKLSHVMAQTAHGGLPKLVEWAWPWILATQPFLKNELAKADPHLSLAEVKAKLHSEFVAKLEQGPFFGGRSQPSMADVAAYPQFLLPFMVGMDDADYFLDFPEVVSWLKAMEPFMRGSPPLLPDVVQKRTLDWLRI
mgnify:CR=1 FL=1